MYESMLSSLPRYSVWPHFNRMMTSLPTLLRAASAVVGRLDIG